MRIRPPEMIKIEEGSHSQSQWGERGLQEFDLDFVRGITLRPLAQLRSHRIFENGSPRIGQLFPCFYRAGRKPSMRVDENPGLKVVPHLLEFMSRA